MTNAPKATWASIGSFGGKLDNAETAFSEGVGGSYLEAGIHKDLVIETVEPGISKTRKPYIMLTLKAENGASTKYCVMLNKNEGDGFSINYQKLAVAVTNDAEVRMRTFGKAFRDNPALLESLTGMKITAELALGKTGYTIKENEFGQKIIIDSETDAEYPELKGQTYDDYTEAKDAAKGLGVYARKPEVKRVSKPTAEALATNEAALQEILRSVEASSVPKAAGPSRAAKPRPTI